MALEIVHPARRCDLCEDEFVPEQPARWRCFICAPRFVDGAETPSRRGRTALRAGILDVSLPPTRAGAGTSRVGPSFRSRA